MNAADAEATADALPSRVDVAVIGGGPAGASAASALARLGTRVALVDRGAAGSPRGESLPPAATPLLQDLGVWADPHGQGHRRTPGVRSLWGGPAAEVDFVRQPYGMGWQLDRPRFDAHLVRAARAAGAVWCGRTCVVGVTRAAGGPWRLALARPDGTRDLAATVLVDASGRARRIARGLGARVVAYDRLVATVGTYPPCPPGAAEADRRTLVEAVPEGWWSAAPLPDGRLVVAHLSDADLAARHGARTPIGWEALLRRTTEIGARVAAHGGRLEEGPRPVSADSSRLEGAGGPAWWAVGDAAAAHDPLSSLGLMQALEAGMRSARAIAGLEARADYAAWVRRTYAQYLAQWLGYYALEQRWPAAPFWRRRHAAWERLIRP